MAELSWWYQFYFATERGRHGYDRNRREFARAPHPDPGACRDKFSGPYEHRALTGGIGHNLPQEAPQAFAQAIIDAGRL